MRGWDLILDQPGEYHCPNRYMYVGVCMCVYTYIHIYVYIYIYIYIYINWTSQANIVARIGTCMYACMYMTGSAWRVSSPG